MKPEDLVNKLLDETANHALADLVKRWVEGKADSKEVISILHQHGLIEPEDFAKYGTDGIYVEPGSREHGLIHVFFDTDTSGEILTVSPDGIAERIINK